MWYIIELIDNIIKLFQYAGIIIVPVILFIIFLFIKRIMLDKNQFKKIKKISIIIKCLIVFIIVSVFTVRIWGPNFYKIIISFSICHKEKVVEKRLEEKYGKNFNYISQSRIDARKYSGDTLGQDINNDYSVKYITSGGYPTFEYCFQASGSAYPLMTGMIELAAARGDAIALIDHTNNPTRDLYPSTLGGSGNAVIDVIRAMGANIDAGDFAAMFTPWYECSHGAITSGASSAFVPASVAYLSALAVQLRNYNPWLAVSGVTRGKVPNLVTSDSSDTLHTVARLTNNIADAYQTLPTDAGITQVSINPITYIRNVGYCIWGNRTLRNNNVGTSALSFLNVRGIVSDIKKLIYEACQTNLFEQNTDITWINFKSVITPLLDRMTSNYVLQDYSITRYIIDPVTGENVPAYKVLAVIRIQPINSIEVFDLTVQLENAEVVVAEI